MFSRLYLITMSMLLASVSYAECLKLDPLDPFEPVHKLGSTISGKARCLNSAMFRPVSVVKTSELEVLQNRQLIEAPGVTLVRNVRHLEKYWVASIPLNEIKDAIFQIHYFGIITPSPLAHAQIRVRFNEPVVLYRQQVGSTERVSVRDLVFTVNAATAPGESFDPFSGLVDDYVSIWRIISLDEVQASMNSNPRYRTVEQIKLNLSKTDVQKYVEHFIAKSTKAGVTHPYNTLFVNCGHGQFEIFDSYLTYSSWQRIQIALFGVEGSPMDARTSLELRGIMDPRSSSLPNLADEPRPSD